MEIIFLSTRIGSGSKVNKLFFIEITELSDSKFKYVVNFDSRREAIEKILVKTI